MTCEEVKAVLNHLEGDKRLMASLMYGSGLRLMECLRLRVQDIDTVLYRPQMSATAVLDRLYTHRSAVNDAIRTTWNSQW